MKGITTFVPGDYWVHLDDVGESPLSACCEHEGLKNNVGAMVCRGRGAMNDEGTQYTTDMMKVLVTA